MGVLTKHLWTKLLVHLGKATVGGNVMVQQLKKSNHYRTLGGHGESLRAISQTFLHIFRIDQALM